MPVVFLLLFSLSSLWAQATYYLASDGNDANDGRSISTPWKTISKVATVALSPGDEVLFHSGDTFFGQLNVSNSGSAGAPIRLGSYGSGSTKPVITGITPLTNWAPYSGSIYVTKASRFVANLWCNSNQMTVARFPNADFIFANGTDGSSWVSAPQLDRPSGYWVGTTVHVRATYFSYETRTVSSHSGSTINFDRGTDLSFASGWGFYLDGKLEELDAPGEWYCDPATNNVYFWSPTGADPNSLTVEGSVLDYGVNCDGNNVSVEGLRFEYQAKVALRFAANTSGNRIASCDVFGSGVNGVQVDGESYNYTITDNTFSSINGCGIDFVFSWTHNSVVSNNRVTRIGMVPGYGLSGVNGMSGIVATGGNNLISGNFVDSTGYNGIRCDGTNNTVENNIVRNSMMKLADGGGIYAYSSMPSTTYGQVWRNNIVQDVTGNVESTPGGDKFAIGLYLDHGCRDMLIENNTVIRAAGNGLFMQFDDYNCTFRGNVFYDCGSDPGGYFIRIVQNTSGNYGNNRIVKNVFFSLSETPASLVMIQGPTYQATGVFDSNYYCSPGPGLAVATLALGNGWDQRDYPLDQWQNFSGQDQHSRNLYTSLTPFAVDDSSASDAVTNGTFDSDISGWAQWGSSINLEYAANAGLDGGSLRASLASVSSPDVAAAISIPGATQGQWYQLRFSIRGTGPSVVYASIRRYHEPWTTVTDAIACPVSSERTEQTLYMQANSTDANVRLEFRCYIPGAVFYLDNVSLKEVTGTLMTPGDQAPIFTNPSAAVRTIQLGPDTYYDLDGNPVPASLPLAPFSSKVLVRNTGLPSRNTGVNDQGGNPDRWGFKLFQNYPNPFNPSTTIKYTIPGAGGQGSGAGEEGTRGSGLGTGEAGTRSQEPGARKTRLVVYDALGRQVTTLVDELKAPGSYEVQFDGSRLASGVYLCRLVSGGFSAIQKLLLVK